MKTLTITYAYPPYHKGGYEIRCRDVMERLKQKGHEVVIITTLHPSNRHAIKFDEPGIFRVLHHKYEQKSLAVRIMNDIKDIRFIRNKIKELRPDIVYLWQIATLSDAIPPFVNRLNLTVVHDVADFGLIAERKVQQRGLYFNNNSDASTAKKLLRHFAYALIQIVSCNLLQPFWRWPAAMKIVFNSEHIKEDARNNGIPVDNAVVLFAGVDTQVFTNSERSTLAMPVKIITPGRIVPLKGTRDAILLTKFLIDKGIPAELLIIGSIGDLAYLEELTKTAKNLDLIQIVEFGTMVNQMELANKYHQHSVCYFPSYWKSGLSAVPLEAMACGCLAISYGNENSSEVISNQNTGYIVQEEDYEAITNIIRDLISDPAKYQRIIKDARQEIESKYTMDRYVNDIEFYLNEMTHKSKCA